ncbi:MAG: ATP-binding cassette domain-containing protein [Kiritimatiellaeota bacterium]|nr:ATP-binding cassette domain-containing protein [Kiritimatiellota bacterium]
MNDALLSIRDISLAFASDGVGGKAFQILDNLSLDIPRGQVTAMVGGNGAGKTTLFNILSGFQRADAGTVQFDGRRMDTLLPDRIARLGIGRLFQGRQLFSSLTLLENFSLAHDDATGEFPFSTLFSPAALRRTMAAKETRACAILSELFGEDCPYLDRLHAPVGALSFGEQRLLSLARLLMSDATRLILLDEPTAGVNPAVCETIADIIRRMVRDHGQTVFLIEHNMPFVREVASQCAYMTGGKIAAVGAPAEILDSAEVRASYLGLMDPATEGDA